MTGRLFGLSQMAISVSAIVVALAIGSWLARPAEDRDFVAGSAARNATTSTPRATATPAQPSAAIVQPVVEKPVAEEELSGNAGAATSETIEDPGDGVLADVLDWRASVNDVAPALGRFVVELKPTNSTEARPFPKLMAKLEQQNDPNQPRKWLIRLELADAKWQQTPASSSKMIGTTPIQQVTTYPITANRGVGFGISLDDARPWRVGVMHNPLRVVVDVGGAAASDSIAVYSPRAGETSRNVTVSGFARVFEAHVAWRIKDAAGREVAKGFTTASIGTSPLWGSFQTTATIPASVSGNVTLEVFWPSPKDGSDLGLVRVPLTVR
jgi:immunoglobulin-like protein involved in spore germination